MSGPVFSEPPGGEAEVRRRATEVVAEIAERLADPGQVAALVTSSAASSVPVREAGGVGAGMVAGPSGGVGGSVRPVSLGVPESSDAATGRSGPGGGSGGDPSGGVPAGSSPTRAAGTAAPPAERTDAAGGVATRASAVGSDPAGTATGTASQAGTAGTADASDAAVARPSAPSGWSPLSLAEGHPGIAVLFAELARTGPGERRSAYRRAAHAHLAAAVAELRTGPSAGLFHGVPALVFAADTARVEPDDYAGLLRRLDPLLERLTLSLLERENQRLESGRPGVAMAAYDAVSGAAGLGRLLLNRLPQHRETLVAVLRYLVRLGAPVRAHGHTVPGWWVPDGPGPKGAVGYPRGHVNLGLAHGISGPLALLSAARLAGVRVEGQADAIERVAAWLLSWRQVDGQWPGTLDFDTQVRGSGGEPTRSAWCYGTLGVATALHQAGRALHRGDWCHTAREAVHTALAGSVRRGVSGDGLCHGRSGLLHLTGRLAGDPGLPAGRPEARLRAQLPGLARDIVDAYDPDTPFGYRQRHPAQRPGRPSSERPGAGADVLSPPSDGPVGSAAAPVWHHRAGLLEGAAGIALALNAYVTGCPPATGWDTALLAPFGEIGEG